jgi:hypothetical protein
MYYLELFCDTRQDVGEGGEKRDFSMLEFFFLDFLYTPVVIDGK